MVQTRLLDRLAVGVVGFAFGGIVDARGEYGYGTRTFFSLCLYVHPHHPPLRCLELLLHLVRHRPRARSVEK